MAKYGALMAVYVNLRIKANKTDDDNEKLAKMKADVAKLNDMSFCLRLQAGMGGGHRLFQ